MATSRRKQPIAAVALLSGTSKGFRDAGDPVTGPHEVVRLEC
jgi:hypothetical protein